MRAFLVRAWQADGRVVFFGGDWIVDLVPHAGRDRPVKGQRHDQDQAGEAIGILDMGLFEAKPARFEVGEHRLDAQRSAYPKVVRYPGLADMAMIQGSACPGSRMMPMLVVTRWPVRA